MKYQEYFQQAYFSKVWDFLQGFYKESVEAEPLYEAVFNAVRTMSVDNSHSDKLIEVIVFRDNSVKVTGAPDPQEWLVGREVGVEYQNDLHKPCDINTLTAHLLYWSTLYGIKTQKMQEEGFSKWLDYGMRGPFYTISEGGIEKMCEGVMMKYIFLDFDGVLNTEQYQAQLAIEGKPTKDEYGPLFDSKAVGRLARIVEETKAEILVTSSWGEVLGEERVIEMWEKREMPGHLHAVFVPDEKCDTKALWVEACSDKIIFLPYIILDDEDVFLPEQEKHFIKINSVTGLTKEAEEKSIELLNELDDLPPSAFDDRAYEEARERIGHINSESCERKKLLYWKGTILADEAYDWSWNFKILCKKLEYNIGYYRFTQRYVGWEKDVKRMDLACRLMKIAIGGDYTYGKDIYVNTRNYIRFGMKSSDFGKDAEFVDMHKSDLRKEKAYRLVWTVLTQNMKKWWD